MQGLEVKNCGNWDNQGNSEIPSKKDINSFFAWDLVLAEHIQNG